MEAVRCRVELAVDGEQERMVKDVIFPISPSTFTSAILDLEEEIYQENGKLVTIAAITALENIPSKSVKAGDVVYRNWDAMDYDIFNFDETKMRRLLSEYKPLWGNGPGHQHLMMLLDKSII